MATFHRDFFSLFFLPPCPPFTPFPSPSPSSPFPLPFTLPSPSPLPPPSPSLSGLGVGTGDGHLGWGVGVGLGVEGHLGDQTMTTNNGFPHLPFPHQWGRDFPQNEWDEKLPIQMQRSPSQPNI